jgi:hypothetical protein
MNYETIRHSKELKKKAMLVPGSSPCGCPIVRPEGWWSDELGY